MGREACVVVLGTMECWEEPLQSIDNLASDGLNEYLQHRGRYLKFQLILVYPLICHNVLTNE